MMKFKLKTSKEYDDDDVVDPHSLKQQPHTVSNFHYMPSRSLFLWLPSEAHLRLPPFHEKTFKTFVKLHTISEVIFF